MPTSELESLASNLSANAKGTKKFDPAGATALGLAGLGQKPPSVKELLSNRIEFKESKKGEKEDEIPYEPINVKVRCSFLNTLYVFFPTAEHL